MKLADLMQVIRYAILFGLGIAVCATGAVLTRPNGLWFLLLLAAALGWIGGMGAMLFILRHRA